MYLNDLESYFNNLLDVPSFKDYAPNGIQLDTPKQINKLAFGVTCSLELIESAITWKSDAIFVHHGLFWDKYPRIKGYLRERIKRLIKNDIGLIAYHLPLDAHSEYGNSVALANLLGGKVNSYFAKINGKNIGVIADFDTSIEDLEVEIEHQSVAPIKTFFYGPRQIKKVAIVTGAGQQFFEEAVSLGVDTFITGEFSGYVPYIAKEEKINYLAIGHETSELFGLKEMKYIVKKNFDIETKFFKFTYEA